MGAGVSCRAWGAWHTPWVLLTRAGPWLGGEWPVRAEDTAQG